MASVAFSPTFEDDNAGKSRKRLKLLEADDALLAALEAGDAVQFVSNSASARASALFFFLRIHKNLVHRS